VRRGSAEEHAQRVREGFLPLMRQMPGFNGYYLLDGGPDVLITISMFDSADEAFASNEKAADWVRNNVLEFTKGMPEVMVGNVLIAEVRSRSSTTPSIRCAAPSRSTKICCEAHAIYGCATRPTCPNASAQRSKRKPVPF